MSDIYKLTEGFDITSTPKFTKDGHTMFLSDVEKDLNYWRNKTLELQAENAELKKQNSELFRLKEVFKARNHKALEYLYEESQDSAYDARCALEGE